MYEKHFGFKCKPFELIPNPDFLFLSTTHKKAITYLEYGIKERVGFILITGEIGSGKTTIIRNLIKNIDSTVKLSRINNTKVTSEQLLTMINEDYGLETEGKSKTRLLSELNEFLIEQYAKKMQPVLIIDEAQNLSVDLLEEVRMLSNLETDRSKLLQIILIGQPELRRTLMTPELVQLRQRININYHIAPLSIEETGQYIEHRLKIAGNPESIRFHGDMLNQIYKFSHGIPRLINIVCDFALLTSYVEGQKSVSLEIVEQVIGDLESNNYWNDERNVKEPRKDKTENSDLVKTTGDMAIRLIKLEETVKRCLEEMADLDTKIRVLESAILKSSEHENQGSALKL